MKLTGLWRESTFLEYVGRNVNMDTYADILMDALSKKKNSKLAPDCSLYWGIKYLKSNMFFLSGKLILK